MHIYYDYCKKKQKKRPLRFFTMFLENNFSFKKRFKNKKLEIHFLEIQGHSKRQKIKHIKMAQNSILMPDLESLVNFL